MILKQEIHLGGVMQCKIKSATPFFQLSRAYSKHFGVHAQKNVFYAFKGDVFAGPNHTANDIGILDGALLKAAVQA